MRDRVPAQPSGSSLPLPRGREPARLRAGCRRHGRGGRHALVPHPAHGLWQSQDGVRGSRIPLKVRAIAIGEGTDDNPDTGLAVLITVDNCGVGAFMTDEVARRLGAKAGIRRERLVKCATHTHCAPALARGLDFIFGVSVPTDQKARIERSTKELIDAMEQAALRALAARAPGRLCWGQGSVGFAANRRVLKKGKWVGFGVNPNGPTDPNLPVLRVTDPEGKVRAVLMNYACHCTTLGGEFNQD